MTFTLKTFKACPFCGGKIVKKYSGLPDRLDTTTKTFSIYECVDCRGGVLSPMPVGDTASLYPTNYLSGEDQAEVVASKFDLEKWYRNNQYKYDFNLLKRASGPDMKATASYLDIGCGSGERVSFAREQGCQKSFGVDRFDFAKNKSRHEDTLINSEILDYTPTQKFQVASLFHVLEHVENPREILAHIKDSILAKNGYVMIQVPNYASFESRLFKRKWFGLDVPRHLWHFNAQALEGMLKDAGYTIEGTYQVNAPLHPVSIVSSIFRDLDVQRIWINRSHGSAYKKFMKLLWAVLTILTIPLTIVQNLFNRSSMLTVVASNKQ